MKNFRRILSFILALCLCFSLVVGASAEEVAHDHENQLIWSFDESDGYLTISGTGTVVPLGSADEQPWAEFREQITYVCVDPQAEYFAEDIAYWFEGCSNLVYAEVPGYWLTIGTRAFAECVNLEEIVFLSRGVIDLADNAFAADNAADLIVMVCGEEPYAQILSANWYGRSIEIADISLIQTYQCMSSCTCTTCTWSYRYAQRDASYHWEYAQCNNCSANEYAYGSKRAHTFSGNTCTVCGYTKSSGSTTTCSHTSTYTSWSGCKWSKYCNSCSKLVSSGTSHGARVYGEWSYYSASQHRRSYACSNCGEGSYEYGSHSTTTGYATHSDSQHKVSSYCSACSTTISTSYASHSLTYSSWSSCSADQHSRSRTCAACGYSDSEYGDHADTNSDGRCDICDYSMRVFSVTVPTSLPLVMDESGNVTGIVAQIVNSSTGDVTVSAVTLRGENGWKIVPYATNIAHQKVDAKMVGFCLNGAATVKSGEEESLSLTDDWTVPQDGSLDLDYDAVVSALSQAVKNETILSAIFVLKWT